MTIISLGDKLKKPAEEPLVTGEVTPNVLLPQKDVEGGTQARAFRVAIRKSNPYTTVCVFFLGMMVLSTGILGGLYCFQHWGRKPAFLQFQRLRDIFNIAGNNTEGRQLYLFDHARPAGRQKVNVNTHHGFLIEEIETQPKYERITVPSFNGSNRGVFVHDFEMNLTAIVDTRRCFVMPLNREQVLPPASLADFIKKNNEGYYDVDTDFVRKNMRVVQPPVMDTSIYGRAILEECFAKTVYQLEQVSPGVQKRNAEMPAVFRAFAGKPMEIAIVNYEEILENEAGN